MTWPGFFAVANAWWFLLLIPIVVFYFLKLRRPRLEVSSLALWQSVLNDQRVNSPFQRFRRNILLWLQLLLLVLLVLAAMQPFIPGDSERGQFLPVIVDCSASMAAVDPVTGESRLDLAKSQIRRLIEDLLPGQQVSLIAMHSTAQRITEFTSNRRVLLDALDHITIRDVPAQLEDALRLSEALARAVEIEHVVIYSDGNFPQRVSFQLPFKLNYQKLPPGGLNVGITAFNAQQRTPPKWEVFLRLESSAAASGSLELWQDGTRVVQDNYVLDAGESQRLTFDVTAETRSRLEARLVPGPAGDSLASDNTAYLDLPAARNLRVYIDPELRDFRRALETTEGLDIYPAEGKLRQVDIPYDLVITDKATDDELEATVRVTTGVIPSDLSTMVERKPEMTDIIDWNRTSPLLQHMQLRDVQISEDIVRLANVTDGDFEELGYSIEAYARSGPIVLQKRTGARVAYYILFHTNRSTLPYRVAFPILAHNAVELALHEAAIAEVRGARTRVLPELTVDPAQDFEVANPQGERVTVRSSSDGVLSGVPAPYVGRYQVYSGVTAVTDVAVSVLDSLETSLASVEQIQFDELAVAAADERLEADQPLWPLLAMLGLAVLLTEWWFFQRPSVT